MQTEHCKMVIQLTEEGLTVNKAVNTVLNEFPTLHRGVLEDEVSLYI